MDRRRLHALLEYVSEHKRRRFEEVLRNRTRHLTVVLEDVYQPHNASACLRSCDCFGIQDVHVIENYHRFNVSRDVALGSAQWLTVSRHNREDHNTRSCLGSLRRRGYKIVAASPHREAGRLEDVCIRHKTALVFGSELEGLTDEAEAQADEFLQIPLYGFTESLNISVAVAVCLHHLTWRLRQSDVDWHLGEDERFEIKSAWAEQVVGKHWGPLLEKLRAEN